MVSSLRKKGKNMENFVVTSEYSGVRLDRFLRHAIEGLPQSMIQKWTRKGMIRVNKQRCKADMRVNEGDKIVSPSFKADELYVPKKTTSITPGIIKDFKSWVVYENDDLLVINKPAGIAVQGGTKLKIHLDLIFKAIEEQEGTKLRLVHRLDKETSGLLILAKNRLAAERLTEQFLHRGISKYYVALVVGRPFEAKGEINIPLSKGMTPTGERVITDTEDAREAITAYKVLQTLDELSLLLLEPKTGRTHQLRAHCQYGLGTPILGDAKYGGKGALPFGREENLFLHCCKLVIPTSDGQTIKISTKMPSHFFKFVKDLTVNF
jgi:23S rRNA pseudouridine955/2504/2580 synthase